MIRLPPFRVSKPSHSRHLALLAPDALHRGDLASFSVSPSLPLVLCTEGDMAETRRQLFKASVLSAAGLASCTRLFGTAPSLEVPVFMWGKIGDPGGQFQPLLIRNENGALKVYYLLSYPNYWPFDTNGDDVKRGGLVKSSDIYVKGGNTRFRTDENGSLEGDPPGVTGGATLLSWNEVGKQ